MLSVDDIRNARFRKAKFGGYKPEDVEMFLDDVQISFETMVEEKEKLMIIIRKLNEKLDKFHEDSNSIKNVILSAQKISEKTLNDTQIKANDMIKEAAKKSERVLDDAKVKTNDIIREANEKSGNIISQAQKEADIQNEISEKLRKESENLKNKLLNVYNEHMKLLNEIPTGSDLLNIGQLNEKTESIAKSDKVEEKITETSEKSIEDIFSDGFLKNNQESSKFQSLKFGQNYSIQQDSDMPSEEDLENVAGGAFGGLFRKNKLNG